MAEGWRGGYGGANVRCAGVPILVVLAGLAMKSLLVCVLMKEESHQFPCLEADAL